jgi:hypothetical protein
VMPATTGGHHVFLGPCYQCAARCLFDASPDETGHGATFP